MVIASLMIVLAHGCSAAFGAELVDVRPSNNRTVDGQTTQPSISQEVEVVVEVIDTTHLGSLRYECLKLNETAIWTAEMFEARGEGWEEQAKQFRDMIQECNE